MLYKMNQCLWNAKEWMKAQANHLFKEEKGGAEIVALILIIIIVIGLVALFGSKIKELVTGWLDQIGKDAGSVVD